MLNRLQWAEVIRPVCWIILCLQYFIVNEGGLELPCMTGLLLLLLLLLLLSLLLLLEKKFYNYIKKNLFH